MLGLAVVVDDPRKGPRLAFSYPLGLVESRGSDHERGAADFFARIFRPPDALCNQPFEVTVEDTLYVTFPVLISQPTAAPAAGASPADASATTHTVAHDAHALFDDDTAGLAGRLLATGTQTSTAGPTPLSATAASLTAGGGGGATGATGGGGASSVVSMFNVIVVTTASPLSPTLTLSQPAATLVAGGGSASKGGGGVPASRAGSASSAASAHSAFTSTSAGAAGVSSDMEPAAALATAVGIGHKVAPAVSSTTDADAHLADLLEEMTTEDAHATLVRGLRGVVHRLAAAIAFEERRCGYLSSAVNSGSLQPDVAAWLPTLQPPPPDSGVSGARPASRGLAWELAFVYHALHRGLGASCHLTLNSSLSLSLSLSPVSASSVSSHTLAVHDLASLADSLTSPAASTFGPTPPFLSPAEGDSKGGGGGVVREREGEVLVSVWSTLSQPRQEMLLMPIRPYHSILLLRDAADALALLPPDAAPQLAQLILCASPMLSFTDLQREMAVPFAQLFRYAAHLVHWGLAVITNGMTATTVYTVSKYAVLRADSGAAVEFAARFGSRSRTTALTLTEMLALFSLSQQGPVGRAIGDAGPSAVPPANSAGGSSTAAAESKDGPPPAAPPSLRVASSAGGGGIGGGEPLLANRLGTELKVLLDSRRGHKAVFLDAVVWMLRHGFLTQMHTHVYLLWPWEIRPVRGRPAAGSPHGAGSRRGEGVAVGGGPTTMASLSLSRVEQEHAYALTLGHPDPLRAVFDKVFTYTYTTMADLGPDFEITPPLPPTGGVGWDDVTPLPVLGAGGSGSGSSGGDMHTNDGMSPLLRLALRVEEIRWRCHLTHSDLQAVLATFSNVFVTAMHE